MIVMTEEEKVIIESETFLSYRYNGLPSKRLLYVRPKVVCDYCAVRVIIVQRHRDGFDAYSRGSKGLTKEYKDKLQTDPRMKDKKGGGQDVCSKCLHGGILLCCCGKGCQRRYHPSCVDPPLNYIPPRFWHCIWCVKKQIKLGVHSISKGIQSILDSREVVSNNKDLIRVILYLNEECWQKGNTMEKENVLGIIGRIETICFPISENLLKTNATTKVAKEFVRSLLIEQEKQTLGGELSNGEQGHKIGKTKDTKQGGLRFGELYSGDGLLVMQTCVLHLGGFINERRDVLNGKNLKKNVKAVAMRILEHIFKHYNVSCQEVSTMQAFEISVCWLAVSLLKHRIDTKDSLALAKLYLNFDCKEEEAMNVYSELWKHMKDFSCCLQNGFCAEKCNINGASDSKKTPELEDLTEKQKVFQGAHVLKLGKSATNEHVLKRKSPTTVASQDQTYAHEICLSQKTPSSLPMETDAIFMECSLERQSPVRGTEITKSDGEVSKDPQILVNELVSTDNIMSMSIHPVQLDGFKTDAVICVNTAVPEIRQWHSVMSPVCCESTTLEFSETTLPYMQPSHANLWPLPQGGGCLTGWTASKRRLGEENWRLSHKCNDEGKCIVEGLECEGGCKGILQSRMALEFPIRYITCGLNLIDLKTINDHGILIWSALKLFSSCGFTPATCIFQMAISAIPSFLEHNSACTTMPLDNTFYHSNEYHCNIYEPEVILEAPNDFVEPVNSYSASPVIPPPSTSVPMNENATHVPHNITNPGYMNSGSFQAHLVTYEMSHRLQLQYDYEKEVEMLNEKYRMLLQNVNSEVALKRMELETQCKLVFMNKVLAEVWMHQLDSCQRSVAQCTEQGTDCA
ncbi:hypothetical protein VNO77_17635 [Canavalia gladiata]|uniref:PHD-type domain-containing protein n=1 Tax=Canavalia gladiata TaxID=3824 RepID=A0AAN9LK28_CANGL